MAKHLVAEKLGPTFGQGGDFTVVVEERQGAMAGVMVVMHQVGHGW